MKRVLFDHCVPKPLRRHLPAFEIRTCLEEGWSAVRNGELLIAAETAGFDVLVTADQNLRYQQNLGARQIAILELPRNQLHVLLLLVSAIDSALVNIAPGTYVPLSLP